MVNMLGKKRRCNIVVKKFELQSHYYIHFWTNALKKGMKPFSPLSCGLKITNAVLLQGWF